MKEREVFCGGNSERERDYKLVCKAKLGDMSAFTELVKLYQKNIYKLAFSFFNDRDEAMEIVQETFLRSYEKLDKFGMVNKKRAFKSWLFRIAYNLCIDYYRKSKKYKTINEDMLDSVSVIDSESEKDKNVFDRQHIKNRVRSYIMHLSKRQKQVFILKYYSGYKFSEISEIMNIAVGTVKSLHYRAVRILEKKTVQFEVFK
jgi:RNA polymerase sigma-70 factor (ECF subfamily)